MAKQQDITLAELMEMKQKVFIGIPCSKNGRFSDFWVKLNNVLFPPATMRHTVMGIYISNLQNELVRMFLQTDAEYFWLLNDDQLFPPNALIQLLKRDKDLVAPLCPQKVFPHAPLLYKEGQGGLLPPRYLNKGDSGLVRIAASGGGGMLIKRKIFETLSDPWWEVHNVTNVNGKIEQSSEDFDFCAKVRGAGFELWADLDVSVVHLSIIGLRAVHTPEGDWFTTIMEEGGEVAVPAATEPSIIERPDRRILVPEIKKWKH